MAVRDQYLPIYYGEIDLITTNKSIVRLFDSDFDSFARAVQTNSITLVEAGNPDFSIQFKSEVGM